MNELESTVKALEASTAMLRGLYVRESVKLTREQTAIVANTLDQSERSLRILRRKLRAEQRAETK